jgi:hypothetical protein
MQRTGRNDELRVRSKGLNMATSSSDSATTTLSRRCTGCVNVVRCLISAWLVCTKVEQRLIFHTVTEWDAWTRVQNAVDWCTRSSMSVIGVLNDSL